MNECSTRSRCCLQQGMRQPPIQRWGQRNHQCLSHFHHYQPVTARPSALQKSNPYTHQGLLKHAMTTWKFTSATVTYLATILDSRNLVS
jgi:hypothetical protein